MNNIIKNLITKNLVKKNTIKITRRYIKNHFKYYDEIDVRKYLDSESAKEFDDDPENGDDPIFKKSEINTSEGAKFKEINIEENPNMTKRDFRIYLKKLANEHQILALVNGTPVFPECPESFGILSFLRDHEEPYVYVDVNKTNFLKEIFLKEGTNIFDPMVYTATGFEGNYDQLDFWMTFEMNLPLYHLQEIKKIMEEREEKEMLPLTHNEVKEYCSQVIINSDVKIDLRTAIGALRKEEDAPENDDENDEYRNSYSSSSKTGLEKDFRKGENELDNYEDGEEVFDENFEDEENDNNDVDFEYDEEEEYEEIKR